MNALLHDLNHKLFIKILIELWTPFQKKLATSVKKIQNLRNGWKHEIFTMKGTNKIWQTVESVVHSQESLRM